MEPNGSPTKLSYEKINKYDKTFSPRNKMIGLLAASLTPFYMESELNPVYGWIAL